MANRRSLINQDEFLKRRVCKVFIFLFVSHISVFMEMHDELFLKIQLKLFSNKLDNKISQKVLSLQDFSTVAENEKFPFHDRRVLFKIQAIPLT